MVKNYNCKLRIAFKLLCIRSFIELLKILIEKSILRFEEKCAFQKFQNLQYFLYCT